ncbi:MAG: hypothetical protein CK427_17190 [Leptospira sp.]|nr:MAG: hypothetical protein CK427_17190 [Leptospira sp.]
MKDLTGIGEFSKSLSKPLVKLIEVLSKGCGTISKPYFERKRIDLNNYEILSSAEAKAKAIEIISDVLERKGIESISIGKETISIEQSLILDKEIHLKSIDERSKNRLIFQNQKAQMNIESISTVAAEELQNIDEVSETPVDEDWITRFFKIAEEISNEQMQLLWGRILAGEITKPNSYSLRTLELLRNIKLDEAEIFLKFAELAISGNGISFIYNPDNVDFLKKEFKIKFEDRLLMQELGILNSNDLSYSIQPFSHTNPVPIFFKSSN